MKIKYSCIGKGDRKRNNVTLHEEGIITFTVKCRDPLEGMEDLLKTSFNRFGDILERGHSNGYVALPKGHHYYGISYNDIDVSVHGGLTYGAEETINGQEYYVIGFDTAHSGDNKSNWTEENVIDETLKLYEQTK